MPPSSSPSAPSATASKSTILSYLLLLRFVLFVPITVVGFVLLVVRYGGLSRIRAARARGARPRRTSTATAAA